MPQPTIAAFLASQLVVITDLDGTLLDQENYSYEASRTTVRKLVQRNIPLVLCSSKTYAEMRVLWDELDLRDPFIVENGGAIYIPANYFPFGFESKAAEGGWQVIELGKSVTFLRQALAEAAWECGVQVRTFGTMELSEIAASTGLTLEKSKRAAARAYDEPFLLEGKSAETLISCLMSKGLSVVKGDRFYHVTGGQDKGMATRVLLDLYRRIKVDILGVGLGNSANDISFLKEVHHPILIRNRDDSWDSAVLSEIPGIQKSEAPGPHGWSRTIENLLKDLQ